MPSRLNLELYIAKFFTITMCSFSSPWEPSNHDVNLYGRREKERERIRHTERKKDIPLEINIHFTNDVHIRQCMISWTLLSPLQDAGWECLETVMVSGELSIQRTLKKVSMFSQKYQAAFSTYIRFLMYQICILE